MQSTNLFRPLSGALLLLTLSAAPALSFAASDDSDPFKVDNGWLAAPVNDKLAEPLDASQPTAAPVRTLPQALKDAAAPRSLPSVTATASANVIPRPTPVITAPTVAAPARPVNVPVMPATAGGSKNLGLHVDSTADLSASSSADVVTDKDGESDLALQERNWQSAAEIARQHADQIRDINADDEHVSLDVRMTFLPNPKTAPHETAARPLRTRYAEIPTAPRPTQSDVHATVAECAAVDTYKKKQLEAIEGDRKTLQDLQAAIAALGLQKQLNFMTGAGHGPLMNTAADATGGPSPASATP